MSILGYWHSLGQLFSPCVTDVSARDRQIVARIQDRAGELRNLSTEALQDCTRGLKTQFAVETAPPSDASRIEAAATLQTAARRALNIELYDVQLLAGLVMARGAIAEMQTGEGKTFAAALPAFMQVLAGRRVHVATPNSYLAQRDYDLLRPLFETLGVTVGLLPEGTDLEEKRAVYDCDIVYGTGYEFGFDYLREQLQGLNLGGHGLGQRYRDRLRGGMRDDAPFVLDRKRAFVIVDEIDSVLIDEACLPLILAEAGSANPVDSAAYAAAHATAKSLVAGEDFTVDRTVRSARLTERGARQIHAAEGPASSRKLLRPWSAYVENALHAQWLLQADVDYVVEDRRVKLVDQYTGRIFSERSWSDGLHQAVEVKEGLASTAEHHSAASITRQRYFRMYGAMCGMTGTAGVSAREFWDLYRLPVVSIPLLRPSRRQSLPTRYFTSAEAKWQAIVDDVAALHKAGRPVLIGSRTIETSMLLADRLGRVALPFRLLNGKQTDDEAAIIAMSGQAGAVTIATNMAGRGTDIKLGPGVVERGGLHLIGVERNESRRVDDQLSGRVGRQGDPGTYQFFVAATDEIIARYAPTLSQRFGAAIRRPMPAANRELDAEIESLQRRIERRHYAERRQLLSYDRWLDGIRDKLAPA